MNKIKKINNFPAQLQIVNKFVKISASNLKTLNLILCRLEVIKKIGVKPIYEYAITPGQQNFKILNLLFCQEGNITKIYKARKVQILDLFNSLADHGFNLSVLKKIYNQINKPEFPWQIAFEFSPNKLDKIKLYFSNINRLNGNQEEVDQLIREVMNILNIPVKEMNAWHLSGEGLDCLGLDFLPTGQVQLKLYPYFHQQLKPPIINRIIKTEFARFRVNSQQMKIFLEKINKLEYQDWGFLYRIIETGKIKSVKAWYRLSPANNLDYNGFKISYLTFDEKGQGIYFREKSESKNNDDLFKKMTAKIAQTDFAGYTIQYPPMFSWHKAKNIKRISEWGKIDKNDKLGLYIHVPFCQQKCNFCRYFSKAETTSRDLDKYLDYLQKEISLYQSYFRRRNFHSLYIGGGTPSILNNSQLVTLFNLIGRNFNFVSKAQKCIEVNPQSTNLTKLRILKKYGINRLTIGVQTLNQQALKLANRQQTVKAALLAIIWAKKIKFKNINIDLMAGLPGETMESFTQTLRKIISLKPGMIHVHPFYPTDNTGFIKSGKIYNENDFLLRQQLQNLSAQLLAKAGYGDIKFDASGLSMEARNIQLSDAIESVSSYLGLGPGAVSHLRNKLRYVNYDSFSKYRKCLEQKSLPIMKICPLKKKDEMIYYLTACLRYGPVSKTKFKKLFKVDLTDVFASEIRSLRERGLIFENNKYLGLEIKNLEDYAIYSKYFFDSNLITSITGKMPPNSNQIKGVYL
jgi:oxygen-independent coproporphyrinogen-3 oxidase